MRLVWIVGLWWLLAVPTFCRADLTGYLQKAEPKFAWKQKAKTDIAIGTVYELELTSQEWQGIVWQHSLAIVVPKNTKPTSTMLLWNQGGSFKMTDSALILALANNIQAPVAFLYGVPNQPLLDGLKEDALISETFVRYLKTQDETWPLLFPMVKSVVKSMDAIQEFAKQEWKQDVTGFIISGASKRGWTSYLTAASEDKRVVAIAPLVIDTLNFQKQIGLQLSSYGKPSAQIEDYTRRGLLGQLASPTGQKLWKMVDPYMYKEKLTMPKMLVHGTNDNYWPQEATNVYWDDLPGEKRLLYVPNAGHNLVQQYTDKERDLSRSVGTLSAFSRSIIWKKEMATLTWKHTPEPVDWEYQLSVSTKSNVKQVRLWLAESESKDFRQARWKDSPLVADKGTVLAKVKAPEKGYRTFFVEYEFEEEGLTYFLSSQLRMIGGR